MKLQHVAPGSAIIQGDHPGSFVLYTNPVEKIIARDMNEVLPALGRTEQAVNAEGLTAVGFVAYDAAPAFDPALAARQGAVNWPPLLLFNLYRKGTPLPRLALSHPTRDKVPAWQPSVARQLYLDRVRRIREEIRLGNTYQVNYTIRLHSPAPRHPQQLFARLAGEQNSSLAAFLAEEQGAVCSASPELFFRLDGSRLLAKPMKGTAPRGLWPLQDRQRAANLRRSSKNRAENLMIVDMTRNDMGRIARTGSVKANHLCQLEGYPTVWQMVSHVTCLTDAGLPDIFSALFPAASITGAPKERSMRIISEIEEDARGLYCGAIGCLRPGRKARFNVAIRTAVVDRTRKLATYGVGGGIVWDSRPHAEYEECRRKAAILHSANRTPAIRLLETMRWTPHKGFFLLRQHLARLRASAQRFGLDLGMDGIRQRLQSLPDNWPCRPMRVRLLAGGGRPAKIEAEPMPVAGSRLPVVVTVSKKPIDRDNILLYHKTSDRRLYNRILAAHPESGDVLLWNERGELTESCTANLIVRIGGRWITPPQSCGLLAGVYRNWLLRRGLLEEGIVRLEDLPADPGAVRLINSLRRSRKVLWAADG